MASGVVLVWAAIAGPALRRPGGGVVDRLFVSEAYDGHVALHGRHAVTAEDQGWGPEAVREVLDLGVADPVVSRFALERPGATGHEKPIPAAWLAARVSDDALPEDLLRPPMMSIRLYESPPGRLEDDAAAVRRALGCGELVDLSQAVHDPLIPGRFLRNLVESPR